MEARVGTAREYVNHRSHEAVRARSAKLNPILSIALRGCMLEG